MMMMMQAGLDFSVAYLDDILMSKNTKEHAEHIEKVWENQGFWLQSEWYQVWIFRFGLVSLFNGISTFVGYLMPKPFFRKNSSGTI